MMSFELGPLWPSDMARTPPSFERIENEIWQRFLDGYGDSYSGFYYNVKVGEDRFPDVKELDPFQRMQQTLAVKKIDAVGVRGRTYDLIEIRRHAGAGSLGQLLAYETMWVAYSGGLRPYTLTIVTDHMDIDTQLAVRDRGASVFIV
jgi:hypothetical protein